MNIKEIFHNPSWLQVIVGVLALVLAAVLGAAGLYVSLYLTWQVHSVQAVVLTHASLVNVAQGFDDEIDISFKGQPIDNLSLVDVRIENTGNQPILPAEFAASMDFVFPKEATVSDVSVIESKPDYLRLSLQTEPPNVVSLDPALLNPGDRAILRFVVLNSPLAPTLAPFDIRARIANIKEVELVNAIEQTAATSEGLSNAGVILVLTGIVVVIALIFWTIMWAVGIRPA